MTRKRVPTQKTLDKSFKSFFFRKIFFFSTFCNAPVVLPHLISAEPYYCSHEKEKLTEMSKVALLTTSPTHASVKKWFQISFYRYMYIYVQGFNLNTLKSPANPEKKNNINTPDSDSPFHMYYSTCKCITPYWATHFTACSLTIVMFSATFSPFEPAVYYWKQWNITTTINTYTQNNLWTLMCYDSYKSRTVQIAVYWWTRVRVNG